MYIYIYMYACIYIHNIYTYMYHIYIHICIYTYIYIYIHIYKFDRKLLEGVRGIFTFLVLYDHFHNPKNAIASDFTADTYLFVMISGFTTALQLRETPRFVKVPLYIYMYICMYFYI
jgi:hypothetical protein